MNTRINFFMIVVLFIISCKKDKADVDMAILKSFYFIDSHVNEYYFNNVKNNDTVRLSFENNDTLKLFYYHYDNGLVLNQIDIGYLKYFINNNKINFGWFLDKLTGVDYGLVSNSWDVQILNTDTMIVNRISNNGDILGHFGYKPFKKK